MTHPLCRAAGLRVQDQNEKQCERWTIRADEVEAFLAQQKKDSDDIQRLFGGAVAIVYLGEL